MSKNKKRIDKEKETIASFTPIFQKMDKLGIYYDIGFCDSKHAYVVHAWVNDKVKCNVFMTTLKWVPFGYKGKDGKSCFHKGVSGQGLESLVAYLKQDTTKSERKEYTYLEKIGILKDVLLAVRNETNFDLIDETIEELGI